MYKFRFILIVISLGLFPSFLSAQYSAKALTGVQMTLQNASSGNVLTLPALHLDARFVMGSHKKFQFEIGLSLNQKALKYVHTAGRRIPNDTNLSPGGSSLSFRDSIIYKNRMTYLELPMQFNYFITKPNQGLYVYLGPRPSLGLFRVSDITRYVGRDETYAKIAASPDDIEILYFLRAGVGYEFKIKEQHCFIALFQDQLLDLDFYSSSSPMYSFGISFGVRVAEK